LPNRTLLAGVVETPQGNLYPQLHGPSEVVTAHREDFVRFITGLQRVLSP
jgi:hypothetical protein